MSKIIVAGAGHGGLCAAYLLAEAGKSVTVVEKKDRTQLGYDWEDSFDYNCFEYAGLPFPDFEKGVQETKTFILSFEPFTAFSSDGKNPEPRMLGNRIKLYDYLISLCEEAGVEFVFNTEVFSPVLFGGRVCGVNTSEGQMMCDLLIDSAGMYSPVKMNLPDYLGIEKNFNGCEILHTYRAYYERVPGYDTPSDFYRVLFDTDGNIGLGWYITYEDYVDVLIGRFGKMNISMAHNAVEQLRKNVPYISKKILKGGIIEDIPVRQPIPVLVSDGYAAIGNCACMTLPSSGSGISYSIMAGKILADTVVKDENGEYSAFTLWDYQKDFFKEFGNSICDVDIFRILLNKLESNDLKKLIEEGVINNNDDFYTSLADSIRTGGFNVAKINEIRHQLRNHSALLKKVLTVVTYGARLQRLRLSFPSKYDRQDIQKWYKKYTEFFASISVQSVIDENLIY